MSFMTRKKVMGNWKQINVSLNRRIYTNVRILAAKDDLSVSAWIRKAIAMALFRKAVEDQGRSQRKTVDSSINKAIVTKNVDLARSIDRSSSISKRKGKRERATA
jgi:hypothetical protein